MSKRDYRHQKAQKEGKIEGEYRCMVCGKVDKKNEGHHVIFYSHGGPASKKNIIVLCPECHDLYHAGKLNIDIIVF